MGEVAQEGVAMGEQAKARQPVDQLAGQLWGQWKRWVISIGFIIQQRVEACLDTVHSLIPGADAWSAVTPLSH
ncbi:hypothetical protein D3C81_1747570 [compost metagenome]